MGYLDLRKGLPSLSNFRSPRRQLSWWMPESPSLLDSLHCILTIPSEGIIAEVTQLRTRVIVSPRGHLLNSEDIFSYYNWLERVLLASSGLRPGMLLSILQCPGQLPTTKDFPAPHATGAEVAKLCLQWGEADWSGEWKGLEGWYIRLQALSLPPPSTNTTRPLPDLLCWYLNLCTSLLPLQVLSVRHPQWLTSFLKLDHTIALSLCFLFAHKETVQTSLVFSLLRCQLNDVTLEPQGDSFLVPLLSVNRALMLLGVKKASHRGQTSERLQEADVRLPIKQQGGKCLPFFWLKWVGWGES